MKTYISPFIKILLLCIAIIFFSPEATFAHKLIVEPTEDGVLLVRYDNGSTASIATVTLYDDAGEEILTEEVNEDGYLYYDSDLTVHRIIADDGLGHRASYVMNETKEEDSIPFWIRALLGVSILLFITAFYSFRNKNKH